MGLNMISNYAANVAHRNLTATDSQMTSSLAKLSSGSRVVSAKDDAAAMAIGSRISSEVAALKQASVNAGQASSMLQIADGAMARVSDIMTRMKTLAVQASSGQLGDTERSMLDTEYQALIKEINRISQDTEFNGNKLVGGGEVETITAAAATAAAENGVASIKFDQSVGDAAFQISWDDTTSTLTLLNNKTGVSEAVKIADTATDPITSTKEVRFGQIGATVTLNATFDTSTSPWGSTTATNAFGAGGGITGDITLTSTSLDSNNDKSGKALAALPTGADSEIALSGGAKFASLTITGGANPDGGTYTFEIAEVDGKAAETIDLSADGLGERTVTLKNKETGDSLTFKLNVTAAYNGTTVNTALAELDATVFAAQDTNAGKFEFKLGTGITKDVDTVTFEIGSVSAKALGVDDTSIATADGANDAIEAVGEAINKLNTARADVGASQNRLEFAASNLATTIENQESARSALLDLDVAAEMTTFTSKQILMQAGVSMLAQANQMPQNLAKLLG